MTTTDAADYVTSMTTTDAQPTTLRRRTCPDCGGRGRAPAFLLAQTIWRSCITCVGTGAVWEPVGERKEQTDA